MHSADYPDETLVGQTRNLGRIRPDLRRPALPLPPSHSTSPPTPPPLTCVTPNGRHGPRFVCQVFCFAPTNIVPPSSPRASLTLPLGSHLDRHAGHDGTRKAAPPVLTRLRPTLLATHAPSRSENGRSSTYYYLRSEPLRKRALLNILLSMIRAARKTGAPQYNIIIYDRSRSENRHS